MLNKRKLWLEGLEEFLCCQTPSSWGQKVSCDTELVPLLKCPSTNHSESPKLPHSCSAGKRNSTVFSEAEAEELNEPLEVSF
jgi:hypothetical protein